MSEEIRLGFNLFVNETTAATIDRLCHERNVSRAALVLQALGMLHAAHDASKDGYYHGLSRDRSKLDTVFLAPL